MNSDKRKQDTEAKKIPPKGEKQTKIIWDDTNMRSVYANVSNVTGGREEIVLLFGMNQTWHAAQREVKIQLTDRIILSPFAAKRLSIVLNNMVKDYEKRYGNLEISTQLPNGTSDQ
jgi:hypothetical protein